MHPALRCAINPDGPCEGCRDFVAVTLRDRWGRNRGLVKTVVRGFGLGVMGAIVIGSPAFVAAWVVVNWPIMHVHKLFFLHMHDPLLSLSILS